MDWSDSVQKHVDIMYMCAHISGLPSLTGGREWRVRARLGPPVRPLVLLTTGPATQLCWDTWVWILLAGAAEAVQEGHHHHGGPRRARHAHRQVLWMHRSWRWAEILVHYLCCLLGQLPDLYIMSSRCCVCFLCEMINWSRLNVECQMNCLESYVLSGTPVLRPPENLELCIVLPFQKKYSFGRCFMHQWS